MQDDKSADHNFLSPYSSEPRQQPTEDYFPNNYPIDDALVTSAETTETKNVLK